MKNKGQSIIEILIGIAVGALLIIGGVVIIAPVLKSNQQVTQVQSKTELANELVDNLRAWAAGSWNNVLSLATGTQNTYYLTTATSSFRVVAATSTVIGGGTTSSTVAVDAVGPNSGGTDCPVCNSLSWNHTVGSESNALLTAAVAIGPPSHNDNGMSVTMTYNGVSMTSAGRVESDNDIEGDDGFIQLFYLIAPPSGLHAIQATLSGGPADMEGGSVSFTGVNQSTPLRNFSTNFGWSASASTTVTSASGDMVVDALANGSAITGSNQTLQWNENQDSASAGGNAAQSAAAGASSVTMGYSMTSDLWGIIAADVAAAPSVPNPSSTIYSGTSTEMVSLSTNNGTTTYTRYFYVSDVYRDSNGNVTSTASGNSYDPATKQVNVVLGVASSTAASSTYIFYLTRNGNNVLGQSSWAGGSGQTGPVTFLGTSYAGASNVTISGGGSIQLSTGGGVCVL